MPLLPRISSWFTETVPADETDDLDHDAAPPDQTGEVLRRPKATSAQSGQRLSPVGKLPKGVVVQESAAPARPEIVHAVPNPLEQVDVLRTAIDPVRKELLLHPIYSAVSTLPRLRTFMSIHVYAVWDFMCLAKRLQRDFTCLAPIWLPPKRPALARFINGLITGEESDIDPDHVPMSHLQLYMAAMGEVGAPTGSMHRFLALLEDGSPLSTALASADAPWPAQLFVQHTLDTVIHGTTVEVLASFLYGREDLIPAMFSRLLPRWGESRTARGFAYYVDRHIELDGDDHGPAAQRALAELCGNDAGAWAAARDAAEQAMRARIELWNGVIAELD